MIKSRTNSRPKQGPPLETPRTIVQVRGYAKRKVLWMLWPFQRSIARDVVRSELSGLVEKYPHANQVLVYEREKETLESLLSQLADVE